MVKVLLDTHACLWILADDPRLTAGMRDAFTDQRNQPLLSMASVWEIFIKVANGKLQLPGDAQNFLDEHIHRDGIELLPVRYSHTAALLDLPKIHRDPFDMLIIAQGILERVPIMSSDAVFREYGVEVILQIRVSPDWDLAVPCKADVSFQSAVYDDKGASWVGIGLGSQPVDFFSLGSGLVLYVGAMTYTVGYYWLNDEDFVNGAEKDSALGGCIWGFLMP